MNEFLNRGIKDIIHEFPRVADVLNEYQIGCVPCNVGTCLLKDIVEIHNLSVADERKLLQSIAEIMSPGQPIQIPEIKRKPPKSAGQTRYSPPMKRLVDEHVLIKRLLALVPHVASGIQLSSEEGRQVILDCVDFIRSYADKFHHAKEEDILFKYFDADLDILKVMHQDHEAARAHTRAVFNAVEIRDENSAREHLLAYQALLSEHIKKEDEILYPWMDRNLSVKQIGELFERFNTKDAESGENLQIHYTSLVKSLEDQYKKKEK